MSNGHYLDSKKLNALVIAYQLDPEPHKEELGRALLLLAEHVTRTFNYGRVVDVDDGIQACATIALLKIHKFDSSRGKAFNFLTTVMVNELRHGYRQVQKVERIFLRLVERQIELGYKRSPIDVQNTPD